MLEQVRGGARCPAFGPALAALIRRDIRAAAISYHRRLPHSRLEIFERTGHLPQLERPLRFNLVLGEFLDE